MKLLRKVAQVFDGTLMLLYILAGILVVFIMLSVNAEVFMRYFLTRPLEWVIEITEYSLLFMTFLGAAWLLKREGHVRMELVITQFDSRTQALINTVTSIIGAIICLTITGSGLWATVDTYQMGYLMATELEPPKFLTLFIIPLGSFLLFIQFLRRTRGYLREWTAPKQETGVVSNP